MKHPENCSCGRGKASAYDNKCGHCRTQRERKAHQRMIDPPWTLASAFENLSEKKP